MKAATLSLLLLVALRAPSRASEEILFEDPLASRLRDGWSWVREEPASWRLTPHGLEMRVRPGNLWGPRNDSVNVLVRPAPAPVPGRLEICVTVSNRPTPSIGRGSAGSWSPGSPVRDPANANSPLGGSLGEWVRRGGAAGGIAIRMKARSGHAVGRLAGA